MFTRKSHSLSCLQGEQQSWRHPMQISSVCYIYLFPKLYTAYPSSVVVVVAAAGVCVRTASPHFTIIYFVSCCAFWLAAFFSNKIYLKEWCHRAPERKLFITLDRKLLFTQLFHVWTRKAGFQHFYTTNISL
jgi:hypothetical protein